MKTSIKFPGLTFRILTVILAGLLTTQFLAAQGWYSADWQYRMPVTVANPGSTYLSGFQVQIDLTGGTGGNFDFTKAEADGSDIRLTSSNGTTLIPFWLEEWDAINGTASIWVKVPGIPTTETTVYLYYGNGATVITDPPYVPYVSEAIQAPAVLVEMPPSGPYTKHPENPIIPIGRPATGATSLLAENIVYDAVTGHYWMVLSNQTVGTNISLVYSDDPTNPDAWYWPQVGEPAVPAGPVIANAIAPHLIEHNGTWYIFYGDRSRTSSNGSTGRPISVASSSSVSGPYTYLQEALPAGLPGTWESYRVDEPYVFQRSDGKWIMMYMAETGVLDEQVGYAIADNLLGPYSKYTGNPCLAFDGTSFDAGTIADPWVYEFKGVYYIGYTVSPTTSGWSTALATTEDWQTFTKHEVILDRGTEGNSFRGAVTRIGDEYVLAYTGNSYNLCIATQPVYTSVSTAVGDYTDPVDPLATIDNPDAVFDFYDGFDTGTDPDVSKWVFRAGGTNALTAVSNGLLTMTATGTYARIDGLASFGMGYIGETYGRHPVVTAGIVEAGFVRATPDIWTSSLRITDNFPTANRWQRIINSAWVDMAGAVNSDWHLFSIYRESPGTVGFRIDDNAPEEVTAGVPTSEMAPFLMSYNSGNQFIVDWTRVRKWAGADPVPTAGSEESYDDLPRWTGAVSTDWHDPDNWIGGVPGVTSDVLIPNVTNQPVIDEAATCNNIVISSGASVVLTGANTFTINGSLTNNGGSLTSGEGSALLVNANMAHNGGSITMGSATVTIGGNWTSTSGTLNLGACSIEISGDWINDGGTYTPGTSTVTFNGAMQIIGGTAQTSFNNLTIACSGAVTLNVNTMVGGNLSITDGVFDLGSYTCEDGSDGGVLTLTGDAILKIGHTNTLPAYYSTHSLSETSTVEYYGGIQAVASLNSSQVYGNLILSGTGAKAFPAGGLAGISKLSIKESATATLADGSTSSTNTLILGGVAALIGSYGSSISPAVNPTDTYFTSGYSGIINHTALTAGTWIGENSAAWHSGSNWAGGLIPVSGTNIIIPASAAYQPVIYSDSPPAVCGNLTIEAGASLLIGAGQALTVNGDLSNSGTLTIESANVLSSGSLMIVTGNSTGNVIYNRQVNTSNNLYHFFSSPVDATTFPTTATVYEYNEPAGAWVTTTTNVKGRGYTLQKGITSLSFTGTVVTADVTVEASSPYADAITGGVEGEYNNRTPASGRDFTDNWGGGGWNLLGNPYTSALNVGSFITGNSTQFDPNYMALYLYDGSDYRYVSNPVGTWLSGTAMNENFIQAGQGFFVLAMNDASEFTFKRTMQGHDTDVLLLKSASAGESWPGLQLNVRYGEKVSSTLVVYNESMTAGLDPGYDIGLMSSGPEVDIYTTLSLADNGVNFTRQALPITGADKLKIAVGIDSENGGDVTFSAVTVPIGTNRFWLEDRVTGTFTDLTTKSYTANLPANTFGDGRFYIISSANTPTSIKHPGDDDPALRIWISGGNLIIKGELGDRALYELYDLNGKTIMDGQLEGNEFNIINLPGKLHGVYVVRVVDGLKITTRKVAVL